jgi:hypothetical protein
MRSRFPVEVPRSLDGLGSGAVRALVLMLVPFLPPASLRAAEGARTEVTGRLETAGGIQVLYLWGSPHERGFAHGYLLAEQIIEEAEEGFAAILGRDAAAYASRILPLVAVGFSFSDSEMAELKGLLEGIAKRLPDKKVEALGRPMNLGDIKVINTYGDWYALGCSSAAVWGKLTPDGKPAVVRNFDFMPFASISRWQHLRVVAPGPGRKKRGWVGVSLPGTIGCVTAMSQEGVFVAIHDVWVQPAAKDYIEGNVPRLLALRRILEDVPADDAVEKAVEMCRSWSTLFGNNFIVATPDTGAGLPVGIIEYDTREDLEGGATLRGPVSPAGETAKTREAGTVGKGRKAGDMQLEYVACSNGHRRRGKDSCDRYDALISCCRERRDAPFDLAALVDLVSRAALPSRGKPVEDADVGTLHQVLGLTGERRLWVRFLESREKNIRDAKWVEFEVDALLSRMSGAAQAGGKAGPGAPGSTLWPRTGGQ